jgi:hypothetical protein
MYIINMLVHVVFVPNNMIPKTSLPNTTAVQIISFSVVGAK